MEHEKSMQKQLRRADGMLRKAYFLSNGGNDFTGFSADIRLPIEGDTRMPCRVYDSLLLLAVVGPGDAVDRVQSMLVGGLHGSLCHVQRHHGGW